MRSILINGSSDQLTAFDNFSAPAGELGNRLELNRRISAARGQRVDALAVAAGDLTRRSDALLLTRTRAGDAVAAADRQVSVVVAAESRALAAARELGDLERARQASVVALGKAADAARVRYQQMQAASARAQALLAASTPTFPAAPTTVPTGPASVSGFVMPAVGVFTSPFGYRVDPFGLGRKFHAGQDIAAPTGTPIVAATSGTVAFVQTPDQSGGYGNYTCINRGDGLATCYAHQSVVFVHAGQPVRQGDEIGLVGSTGASTGAHLHFEVRINGVPVDPMPYLPR